MVGDYSSSELCGKLLSSSALITTLASCEICAKYPLGEKYSINLSNNDIIIAHVKINKVSIVVIFFLL
jgi:hypothetical protein